MCYGLACTRSVTFLIVQVVLQPYKLAQHNALGWASPIEGGTASDAARNSDANGMSAP